MRPFQTVANVGRRLRGRALVEVGDALDPNYTHRFTRDEIASELTEGGFRLVAYEPEPYPHAAGRAV